MLGGGGVKHGDILYDTDGQPAAVITGSWHSEGREPWNIRGRRVWIAVGLASKRGFDKTWCEGRSTSASTCNTNITTIENPKNNSSDVMGSYVTALSTEAQMDASFIYTQEVKNSKELTDAILAYSARMMAANFCRAVVLEDFGAMDLPSIDVLMRIYQARTLIDAADQTSAANPEKKLEKWGFGSVDGSYVWSASEGDVFRAWIIYSVGMLSATSKYYRLGVVPVLEIPA